MPNESAKIILAVTHAKLSKVRDALAVEGTINALQVGFQFRTPDWDNTTKTVVFVRGRATPSTTNADTTYRILNENNECDVPPEMLAQNGMFSVGIFGVRDNYRIVSNWMCYRITDGCYADGSTPIDPSSTIYEQIISMINNKSSIGHNHDERYYTKDESNDKFLTEEDVPKQVQSDWNQNDEIQNDYIKNRPFYEDASVNITWDGDTTDKVSVSNVLYLVSSDTPSVEDLIGCTVTVHTDSGEEHSEVITETMISQPADNVIGLADTLFVALEDGAVYDTIVFPTKGTYFLKHGNVYIASLFKGTLKKLDPKFIDMDSLPKEVLKITVTYNSSTDTYSADKTSDDIKTCLDNGGIPYVYYNKDVYTYVGAWEPGYSFRRWTGGYIFISSSSVSVLEENLYEYTNRKVTVIDNTATDEQYPSALAVKTELDKTVKTTEQTLTDEQKAQARTNIGAGTQYILPEASSSEFGGIKADNVTETDTQAVRKGADGKLYTAAAVPQVQSDYTQNDSASSDYIKNRPFYEYTAVDITWDGDTTGKTEVDLTSFTGINVYLVSDATPSVEDLNGSTLTFYDGSSSTEQSMTLPAQALSENVIVAGEGFVFVVLADNSEIEGITFPSKGTYLASANGNYVSRIIKEGINKIDPKFIPNGIDTLKVTVTYNSSTGTYSNADKSSDDIESCLNNGGIPYIALYGLTSVSNDYIILTYVGYGGMPKRHAFANEGEGIGLYISGFSVSSGLSSQSLKGRINYLEDNTVKTVSQVLTDKQKAQARENIEACDRTHRYEIVESMSNLDNDIDLLDSSSEYSTIGSIIQLKSIAKILMKSLIYTLIYGHAETYDSILSVNTYDNNLNSDATYEYSTSDTGYSTIFAIDANNYKCTLKIRNVDCFEVYFIANTSTLTEEYSSNFSATGVYLKYLAAPSYASQYLRIKFKVLQYYKLSDHYLDGTVERTNHKITTISDSVTDDQYPSALAVKTELDNTVKTTEQTLTDEQKTQARTNIGAEKVLTSETWTFTLEDGTTVTKGVCVK